MAAGRFSAPVIAQGRAVLPEGTMAELVSYAQDQHRDDLRRLLTAYREEGVSALRAAGVEEGVALTVDSDLARLDRFQPPHGQLLLVIDDGVAVGTGSLRVIRPGVAEIKRMYLDSSMRGRGLGRQLLDGLLAEARRLGCQEARLDTGWFMTDAQRLYRAAGFTECEPYCESEVSADFDPRWVYMRRNLTAAPPETPATGQSPRN
jgi:GNAT superfamily N-acetyltransferase